MTQEGLKVLETNTTWESHHEQNWQGHGIAFTQWTDCVTGVGDSISEAMDDAIEQAVEADWFPTVIDGTDQTEFLKWQEELERETRETAGTHFETTVVESVCEHEGNHGDNEDPDCSVCAGEWHVYFSIDVRRG